MGPDLQGGQAPACSHNLQPGVRSAQTRQFPVSAEGMLGYYSISLLPYLGQHGGLRVNVAKLSGTDLVMDEPMFDPNAGRAGTIWSTYFAQGCSWSRDR